MPVAIKGRMMRATERAFQIDIALDDGGVGFSTPELHWIPMSQLVGQTPVFSLLTSGDEITVTLSDWIARQKNLTTNVGVDEVDLERFEAAEQGSPGEHFFFVRDKSNDGHVCTCPNMRLALMVAAAMNLTQGKV